MQKTAHEIQGDIYTLLSQSAIAESISGNVYREGYRLHNSRAEDAIVIFTTGENGQIQTGVVTINVYVPDIDIKRQGMLVENGKRCAELERIAADWVASLTLDKTPYKISLQDTIYTEAEPDIHQHFIVIRLRYSLCSEDI